MTPLPKKNDRNHNHLIQSSRCICGAEFCYQCGTEWKTCPCPNWNEQNLENQAHEIHDREQEQYLTWGLNNVKLIEHDDGRTEWVLHAPAAVAAEEEDNALEPTAGDRDRDAASEAADYIDELVHPGGPFEALEDLTRYLRTNPECEHHVWQAVVVGQDGEQEREGGHHRIGVPCDICARLQHPYLLQCTECRLRVCVGCGRRRFRLP